jgi:hypothetical protein
MYICNFWWQVQLQLIGEGATIAHPSVFQLAPNIVSTIFVFLTIGQSVGNSLFWVKLCCCSLWNVFVLWRWFWRSLLWWDSYVSISDFDSQGNEGGHRSEVKECRSYTQASLLHFFVRLLTPLLTWVTLLLSTLILCWPPWPSFYVYFMHQFSLKNSLIVECWVGQKWGL